MAKTTNSSAGWRRGPASLRRVAAAPAELAQIRKRLDSHDDAILELRALGGRVSELADLVTELLVLAATKEDPEFKALVDKYLEGV